MTEHHFYIDIHVLENRKANYIFTSFVPFFSHRYRTVRLVGLIIGVIRVIITIIIIELGGIIILIVLIVRIV